MVPVPFTETALEGEQVCREHDTFTFGHVELHVPVRHPSRDVEWPATDKSLKPEKQMWASST